MKQFMIDWFKEAMFWTGCIAIGYIVFQIFIQSVMC